MIIDSICMSAADLLAAPARQFTYSLERSFLRPWHYGRYGYEDTRVREIAKRVQHAVCIPIFLALTIAAAPFFLSASLLALCTQKDRIKIETSSLAGSSLANKISILFLNTCLQGGMFATITGDVCNPHDRFDETHSTRIEALVDFVVKQDAEILCFQEVHDRSSLHALKKALKEKGYTTFITDEPAVPVLLNSGLFIASKYPLTEVKFTPYPHADRGGVNYGSLQGSLSCEIDRGSDKKKIALFTTHLAYGSSDKLQQIRQQQLSKHVLPEMKKKSGKLVLFGGDLNEDNLGGTFFREKGYTNLVPDDTPTSRIRQGQIRGKLHPQECVDAAVISDAEGVECKVIEPILKGRYVTDHYGVLVTI